MAGRAAQRDCSWRAEWLQRRPSRGALFSLAVVGLFVGLVGCDSQVAFEPNEVYRVRLEREQGVELSELSMQVEAKLSEWFGDPEHPRWPEFLSDSEAGIVSVDRLQQAAGAISSDEGDRQFGLYRKHCIACHGTTGDGLGPTAKLLNPYPRDYRLGKFKFKSTPLGTKPTRQDLIDVLVRGIPGTSMPRFELLREEELEALVDYVIYLSVRGESERDMLRFAAAEVDTEGGESLDGYADELKAAVTRVAQRWVDTESAVPSVAVPADVAHLYESIQAGVPVIESVSWRQAVESGRELFQGQIASCATCHGVTAMGDGQTTDYDDWAKDYTVYAGLDPTDREAIRPMLRAGALKPRQIAPRNLRTGIYRGGGTPRDLYLRIVHGIEGTPMPAMPLQPANPHGLTERQVWDLVSYLLSLPEDKLSGQAGLHDALEARRGGPEAGRLPAVGLTGTKLAEGSDRWLALASGAEQAAVAAEQAGDDDE